MFESDFCVNDGKCERACDDDVDVVRLAAVAAWLVAVRFANVVFGVFRCDGNDFDLLQPGWHANATNGDTALDIAYVLHIDSTWMESLLLTLFSRYRQDTDE
jgi:hypothetical protein